MTKKAPTNLTNLRKVRDDRCMDPNAQKPIVPSSPQGLNPQHQAAYDKIMNFTPSGGSIPPAPAEQNPLGNTTPQPTDPQPSQTQANVPLAQTIPTSAPLQTPEITPPTSASSPVIEPTNSVAPPSIGPANGMFSSTSAPESSPTIVTPSDPTTTVTPSPLTASSPSDPTGQNSTSGNLTPVPTTLDTPASTTVVLNNDVSPTPTPTTQPDANAHVAKKKGNSMMPILLIVGAIIFIGLYSVIWIRIFGIKVPFLAF